MPSISKVLFIGSKNLGLNVLKKIYSIHPNSLLGAITIDDSTDIRSALIDFKQFCNTKQLDLQIVCNKKETEAIIDKYKPELCFVVGWYSIISEKTLNSVPYGFIGIHNSLLPKYRGGSPLVWSIINNEPKVGFSFFSFNSKMDEGDIWIQDSIDIKEDEYISDILYRIEEKIIHTLHENYLKILNKEIKPTKQNNEDSTYCVLRKPGDGLIDWNQPAKNVFNFIRAQSTPYPGAFTYLENQKIIIWKAKILEMNQDGSPGEISQILPSGVIVICGDNRAIVIEYIGMDNIEFKSSTYFKSTNKRFG